MFSNIKILICVHRPCVLPDDDIFLPIHVGKKISDINIGIQGDDTGDNISEKNKSFCELTALYWAWKNINAIYPNIEYIGLFHYRRYLALDKFKIARNRICVTRFPPMTNYKNIINKYLKKYQIILVKKIILYHSLFTDYAIGHYSEDYRIIKQIIHELYPEYDNSFVHIFNNNNRMSSYNIFISQYSFFIKYCEWLFPILFEAEKRIDTSNYTQHQKRVFGFLAERLLNLYVYHNKTVIKYKPVFFLNQELVKDNFFRDLYRSITYQISFFLQQPIKTIFLKKIFIQ